MRSVQTVSVMAEIDSAAAASVMANGHGLPGAVRIAAVMTVAVVIAMAGAASVIGPLKGSTAERIGTIGAPRVESGTVIETMVRRARATGAVMIGASEIEESVASALTAQTGARVLSVGAASRAAVTMARSGIAASAMGASVDRAARGMTGPWSGAEGTSRPAQGPNRLAAIRQSFVGRAPAHKAAATGSSATLAVRIALHGVNRTPRGMEIDALKGAVARVRSKARAMVLIVVTVFAQRVGFHRPAVVATAPATAVRVAALARPMARRGMIAGGQNLSSSPITGGLNGAMGQSQRAEAGEVAHQMAAAPHGQAGPAISREARVQAANGPAGGRNSAGASVLIPKS